MPIVYLPGQVPAAFNPLLWLNPFTYMVYVLPGRSVLRAVRSTRTHGSRFGCWSVFIFVLGYRLFRRVRPYFANVL